MGFHDQTLPSSAPILGGLLLTPLEPSGQFGFCRGLGSKTFVAMSEVQGDFLAVQDSSITDIVCPLVCLSVPTNNQSRAEQSRADSDLDLGLG